MQFIKMVKIAYPDLTYVLFLWRTNATLRLNASELLELGSWIETHKEKLEGAAHEMTPEQRQHILVKQRVLSVFKSKMLRTQIVADLRAKTQPLLDEGARIRDVALESHEEGLKAHVFWKKRTRESEDPCAGELCYIVRLEEQNAYTIVGPDVSRRNTRGEV